MKLPKIKPNNDDKVIIASEYFEDDRPSYICSICNTTLVRLTDSSIQNTAFWCRHCSVEFDPESEKVATTPGIPDIGIMEAFRLDYYRSL